jgi:hypothetical protein
MKSCIGSSGSKQWTFVQKTRGQKDVQECLPGAWMATLAEHPDIPLWEVLPPSFRMKPGVTAVRIGL